MDPRIIAERKAVATARIRSDLDRLTTDFGFDGAGAGLLKTHHDPAIMELMTLEGVAEVLETVIESLQQKQSARVKVKA